jgi:hypothetical protein
MVHRLALQWKQGTQHTVCRQTYEAEGVVEDEEHREEGTEEEDTRIHRRRRIQRRIHQRRK